MKKILFILTFAVYTLSSLAEDINALLLHLSTGNPVCFMLDKSPSIKFEGSELIINTNDNEIRYPSPDIKKISYSSIDPTDISNADLLQNIFCFDDNKLMVKGTVPNSRISIYKSDGKLVSEVLTDDNGNAQIIIPNASKEIFIMKTAVTNFKITKR